jgi:hypothetical protein
VRRLQRLFYVAVTCATVYGLVQMEDHDVARATAIASLISAFCMANLGVCYSIGWCELFIP